MMAAPIATRPAGPLLYPVSIQQAELIALVSGMLAAKDLASDPDVVTFGEHGGQADLELAIPFLPGMDEVVVDAATLRVRAEAVEQELSTYTVTDAADGQGSFLALPAPARLRKVVVDPSGGAPAGPDEVLRLVVRVAEGLIPGPPVYAKPPFDLTSPMFIDVLDGLEVTELDGGGGTQLVFPAAGGPFPVAQGTAWLLQRATGAEVTELEPRQERFAVRKVTVDAAASDLDLVIRGAGEADPPTPLWRHPGAFLPEAGEQEVSFTPLAQKHLAAALAALTGTPGSGAGGSGAGGAAGGQHTLPIPLRFSAASGGAIRVVAKTLDARYLVRPAGPEAVTLRLGGDWVPLLLRAPASRRPSGSSLRLRARHLGRELNPGSGLPPLTAPRAGLRVGAGRMVAAAVPCAPAAGGEASLRLASARVFAAFSEPVEIVCELRGDAAGAPGPLLAPPLVKQLAPPATPPAVPAWVEFELPAPGATVAVPATVWVTLRSNRGELRWFTADQGEARVSLDDGSSWGVPDAVLTGAGAPLAQLFHVLDTPSPPDVQVLVDGGAAGSIALAAGGSPLEFVSAPGLELPAPVLTALATATGGDGGGRALTALALCSRAVADLTVEELTLSYDPFAI
jgi:hypothetical protein